MTQSCNRLLILGGILTVFLLVGLTSWLARYSSDPLDVLPGSLPEVEARRVYQEHFLQENDFLVVLRAKSAETLLEEAQSLTEELQSRFPALEGRIEFQQPWEKDLPSTGELVAYAWLSAPEAELEQLATRLLSPEDREESLQDAVDTLATAFSVDAETAWLALDPLGLVQVGDVSEDGMQLQEGLGFGGQGLRVLQIDLPGHRNDAKTMKAWMTDLEAAIAETNPEVEWSTAGWAPYLVEITRSMRSELRISALFTFGVVLMLFLMVYRTIAPLFVLAICLAATALGTVLLGDLIYGSLNAISIGFAAILIALVVDYSIIVYQEQAQPSDPDGNFQLSVVGPVGWAAATTSLVFLALNFSAIPGIAQLGTLVALGLILGAAVSLSYFRRLMMDFRTRAPRDLGNLSLAPKPSMIGGSVLAAITLGWLVTAGPPKLNTEPGTMLPKYAQSVQAYEALREALSQGESEPMPLLFQGATRSWPPRPR